MRRAEWSIKTLSHCDNCWFSGSCFIKSNIRKSLDEELEKGIAGLLESEKETAEV